MASVADTPVSAAVPEYFRLLDARALERLAGQEFLARGLVEGFISGRHRSPYRGFSVEFAEHREYVPGDDPRDLDWKIYGRSDRYFIKQHVEETNLRATILLDASGSMAYVGESAAARDGRRLSKFEYARFLAACLAHLLIHQQDAVGLVVFDTRVRRYLPARSRTDYLRVLLEEMHRTQPGGETGLAPIFHDLAERIHRRGVVFVLSDLLDDPEALLTALQHFRFRKHEVIVMHILAEEELRFPFDRWTLFRDLEGTDRRVEVDPRALRAAYLDALHTFLQTVQTGCGRMAIDYVPMNTRLDFDTALAGYLSHRRSLMRIK